jgi:hypothetical protein
MLIDQYLPDYDVTEFHETRVNAEPARVYAALRQADLADSWVVRLLFGLRGLPAALTTRGPRQRRVFSLAAFEALGFKILAEDPPTELLIGLEGKFWTPRGGLRSIDAEAFQRPPAPQTARAAWNFHITPLPQGGTTLSTETRVLTADRHARRRFRIYWTFVGPFSGLIRRFMLGAIKATAESADPDPKMGS